MPGVIEYRVGKSADLFSFKLAQIKALGGLNLVVILVDIPKVCGITTCTTSIGSLDTFHPKLCRNWMREELSGVLVSCVWEIEAWGSEEGGFSFWWFQ